MKQKDSLIVVWSALNIPSNENRMQIWEKRKRNNIAWLLCGRNNYRQQDWIANNRNQCFKFLAQSNQIKSFKSIGGFLHFIQHFKMKIWYIIENSILHDCLKAVVLHDISPFHGQQFPYTDCWAAEWQNWCERFNWFINNNIEKSPMKMPCLLK